MSDTLIFTPATMPYGYGKGSTTKKILISTDGTKFACGGDEGQPCPDAYVADTFGSVMAHRSGQHGRRKARNAEIKANSTDLTTLRKRAEALLADIDKVEAHLAQHEDPYKERALKAERDLARIRRTFAGLVG
jgi:hypothetical protein